MITVQQAKYLGRYEVWLKFSDGREGDVDLSDIPGRYAAAAPLADQAVFSAFYLDEWPTLAWPCGFDLSPEFLYERLTGIAPKWLGNMAEAA